VPPAESLDPAVARVTHYRNIEEGLMARLLLVLVLVAACVIGLGFYLGWFTVTVDQLKMQEDKNKVQEKLQTTHSPAH
jgi:Tfp pilus assembly protein PilO